MEFSEVLRHRRMVRSYTDEPVEPGALERIVAAGLKAPSAGHSQGQSFVIVTNATLRSGIAALADESAYVAMGFDPWISQAPAHIVICVSEAVYRARYAEPDKGGPDQKHDWPVPYWWVDAGAAMMLVLLAAVDEGLAAGFLGSHAMADLSDLLGIPEDVSPIGIVTLGHAAADRRSGSLDRGRRPRSDVVHHDGW